MAEVEANSAHFGIRRPAWVSHGSLYSTVQWPIFVPSLCKFPFRVLEEHQTPGPSYAGARL